MFHFQTGLKEIITGIYEPQLKGELGFTVTENKFMLNADNYSSFSLFLLLLLLLLSLSFLFLAAAAVNSIFIEFFVFSYNFSKTQIMILTDNIITWHAVYLYGKAHKE